MGKITSTVNTNTIFITNELKRPEAVVDWELRLINSNGVRQCLPLKMKQKRRKTYLEVQNYNPYNLIRYFNGYIGRQMFLNFVLNMIEIVKECEEKMLDSTNLFLNYEYIYVNPESEQVTCIYWPLVNSKNESLVSDFFQRLPEDFSLYQSEGNNYVLEYNRYFSQTSLFSLRNFEKVILHLLGQDEKLQQQTVDRKAEGAVKTAETTAVMDLGSVAYDPLANIDRMPQGYKIRSSVPEPKPTVVMLDETNVLVQGTLKGNDEGGNPRVMLLRKKSGETIAVTQSPFIIGRKKERCNYAMSDNMAVSRQHVIIRLDAPDGVTVQDNSSRNGTKLNGRNLTAGISYKVQDGDRLEIADEEILIRIL